MVFLPDLASLDGRGRRGRCLTQEGNVMRMTKPPPARLNLRSRRRSSFPPILFLASSLLPPLSFVLVFSQHTVIQALGLNLS